MRHDRLGMLLSQASQREGDCACEREGAATRFPGWFSAVVAWVGVVALLATALALMASADGGHPAAEGRCTFVSESLLLRVRQDVLDVEGIYAYAWDGDDPWGGSFVYPFAPGRVLSYDVEGRSGCADGAWRNLPVYKCDEGLRYPMPHVAPDRTAQVRVRYRQEVHGNHATYLTRTTRTWHRPVDRAVFTIELPRPYSLQSCTYPVSSTQRKEDATRYVINLAGFWPDQDLTFSWR